MMTGKLNARHSPCVLFDLVSQVLQLLPQRVLQQYIDFEKQGQ